MPNTNPRAHTSPGTPDGTLRTNASVTTQLGSSPISRRRLLQVGVAGLAAPNAFTPVQAEQPDRPLLKQTVAELESFFTLPEDFNDVSRGKPIPHTLSDEQKRAAGLTRETWRLEITADPENPATLANPMTEAAGNAFDFPSLLRLAETKAVRFVKVMTCLNIGCPLGNGIWEGVPLRDVLWLTQPMENLRRVHYYGYHNDKPEQMFRSSLPIGRILEDYFGLPPVILCYKLNGKWLSSERGGPVRVVVPEAYGFKSIKWLSHIFLSNAPAANDTYAEKNNDVDSPLKSFAATLSLPREIKPQTPFAVTGYAQVGVSGVSKVQVWLHREGDAMPEDGEYFTDAPWQSADIIPPPSDWGGGLPSQQIPEGTRGFDGDGKPIRWPIPLSKVHWGFYCEGLAPGKYVFRCRTVDDHGEEQPLPRPFRKSGHAGIERKPITVKA